MENPLFSKKTARGRVPVIVSPADGRLLALREVEDEVFAKGILGLGVAVVPEGEEIYAPVDGVVSSVAETKHAITITADCGAEILIHCGIDTVELRGEGFTPFVAAGDRVMPGKLLLKFDPALVRARGLSLATPIVVVNADEFSLAIAEGTTARRGEPLIRLAKKSSNGV